MKTAVPTLGLWCFLWFVGFCYLTDKWRTSTDKDADGYGRDDNQAAIAFSFFSIIAWVSTAQQ